MILGADGREAYLISITKEIVEGYGGTIDVESQVDVGSTFTIKMSVPTP